MLRFPPLGKRVLLDANLLLLLLVGCVVTKLDKRQPTGKASVESVLFQTLGLTDAGIERVASENVQVLTADEPPRAQLIGRKLNAINYCHIRWAPLA